jgi:hypothetical protein
MDRKLNPILFLDKEGTQITPQGWIFLTTTFHYIENLSNEWSNCFLIEVGFWAQMAIFWQISEFLMILASYNNLRMRHDSEDLS